MRVGMCTFFQNLDGGHSDRDVYVHELSMADMAEPLGFDSVWAAEHHFTDYDMCPSTTQFLTWVAGRTRNVRLGSMIVVLPWHDPVRVAEELSVLDHLSDGRVIVGFGRGLARVEFEGFRREMARSRGTFNESAAAIVEALESGWIESDGEHYRQPRAAIRPRPFKSFRRRSYAAAVSPESAEVLARLGLGVLIIAQKPWDMAVAELDAYRARFREINGEEAPAPIIACFTACHEDEGRAREMFERYLCRYSRSTVEHYEFENARLAEIPGYEYYGALASNIGKHGVERFSQFLADLQVYGTPEQCLERIAEYRRLSGASEVINIFSFGGMPHEDAKANMRLFAERVMPGLKALDG